MKDEFFIEQTEEEKYAEWSRYVEIAAGCGIQPVSYVNYCRFWEGLDNTVRL